MRHNPKHAVDDERVVRRLIAEHPWATIVSQNRGELVASHYPVRTWVEWGTRVSGRE